MLNVAKLLQCERASSEINGIWTYYMSMRIYAIRTANATPSLIYIGLVDNLFTKGEIMDTITCTCNT